MALLAPYQRTLEASAYLETIAHTHVFFLAGKSYYYIFYCRVHPHQHLGALKIAGNLLDIRGSHVPCTYAYFSNNH